MKILVSIIISCLIAFNANAENISQKLSNSLDELIPGEGVTDVSIQVHEEDFPDSVAYNYLPSKSC